MPRIDVVDEAIIDSNPSAVFKAMLKEFEGAKNWWMPHWEAKPRGVVPFSQIGGAIDITVHRIGTPKWFAKSIEIVPDKSLRAEFFEGDFLGNGEWTLEPVDDKQKLNLDSTSKPTNCSLPLSLHSLTLEMSIQT